MITSSVAAVWLPWLLMGAVVMLCLGCLMQPRYIHGLVSNSLQPFSLNAAEQTPSIGAQTGQWVLNIMIAAVCAYTYREMYTGGSSRFLVLLATAVGIDLFRVVAAMLVTYTFNMAKLFSMAYIRYFSLRSLCSIVLLIPVLLLYNLHVVPALETAVVVLMAVYYVLIGIQLGKLYCRKWLDVFFLITYIVTVEIIPTLLLYIV